MYPRRAPTPAALAAARRSHARSVVQMALPYTVATPVGALLLAADCSATQGRARCTQSLLAVAVNNYPTAPEPARHPLPPVSQSTSCCSTQGLAWRRTPCACRRHATTPPGPRERRHKELHACGGTSPTVTCLLEMYRGLVCGPQTAKCDTWAVLTFKVNLSGARCHTFWLRAPKATFLWRALPRPWERRAPLEQSTKMGDSPIS